MPSLHRFMAVAKCKDNHKKRDVGCEKKREYTRQYQAHCLDDGHAGSPVTLQVTDYTGHSTSATPFAEP